MKFTIIIPIVKINKYIEENVKSILELTYKNWELIIVTDYDEENKWGDKRITQVSSGKVSPARKRDMAAKIANGEILVFLDDDSYPSKNLLDVANTEFKNCNCIGIGGPGITPASDSIKQKASGSVFETRFLGGCIERYLSYGKFHNIDDWPSVNFMVRKSAFDAVNGFDTDYWPGEDTILCQKLIEYNKKGLFYSPDLIVWHHRRESLKKHINQVYLYGLHRGFFVRKGIVNSVRLKYFMPTLLVITLFLSAILTITNYGDEFNYLGFLIFISVACLGLLDIFSKHGWRVGFVSIPYVFVTHLCYGVGFMKGIFKSNLESKLR